MSFILSRKCDHICWLCVPRCFGFVHSYLCHLEDFSTVDKCFLSASRGAGGFSRAFVFLSQFSSICFSIRFWCNIWYTTHVYCANFLFQVHSFPYVFTHLFSCCRRSMVCVVVQQTKLTLILGSGVGIGIQRVYLTNRWCFAVYRSGGQIPINFPSSIASIPLPSAERMYAEVPSWTERGEDWLCMALSSAPALPLISARPNAATDWLMRRTINDHCRPAKWFVTRNTERCLARQSG